MVHTIFKLILKRSSVTLQIINVTYYYGHPVSIFTKLRAQDCPCLLCDRCLDVTILNVRYLHSKII